MVRNALMRHLYIITIPLLVSAVFAGCGPSQEERKAMMRFNEIEEIVERGGQVKKLERFEMRPDRVFMIEAEIVDSEGRPIGRLRSERVEGFGTMRPRIQWYETPGVSEEWKLPQRGRRRGQRQGRGQQPRPQQEQATEPPQ